MSSTAPTTGTTGRWEAYVRWNRALADAVYGPQAAGVPTYLDLEEPVLRAAAVAAGADVNDPRAALVEAVRPTLNTPGHPAGPFSGHVAQLRRWRPATGEPPPTIGLLAVLCLAAEEMRESDGIAANNYYDRLMPLLGVRSEADKTRVINSYRRISFDLWESLNGWLESLHGEHGLPTAYAYAHAHIGRPLSQALIRAVDRAKLDEFFSELGLGQRSRLSPADMEPLLTAWINRSPSPASQQIQALWKRSGARERIADIACQLLETWEPPPSLERPAGSVAQASGRHAALRLLALPRTFPSPALELNLVGPNVLGERVAHLFDATNGVDLGVDLALDDLPDGRWRLADPDELEGQSLPEGSIRLSLPSGPVLERHPRRVVPLRKDDLLQAFVEVERLSLGEDGMILCISRLDSIVAEALNKIARPGFRQLVPPPPGCPPGWTLFTHIQVLAPLFSTSPTGRAEWPLDLNVLQPLATSQLIIQGGLQLPGRVRRWSSRVAPEIRAAAEDVDGLRMTIDRLGAFREVSRVLEQDTNEPFLVVDLQSLNLSDGDYEIVALTTSKASRSRTLNTARLRLRSGSHPSPAPSYAAPLAHPLNPLTLGVLHSRPWDGENLAVRGARITPESDEDLGLERGEISVPDWWRRRHYMPRDEASDDDSRIRVSLAKTATNDCFQTGAHVLQLPTFYGKATTAAIEGVCKQCGLVKRFPGTYYRLRNWGSQRKRSPAAPPSFHLSDLAPALPDTTITPDMALDALTHDVSGPAAWLEQLALQVVPSQLFVDRFIRSLDLLAHIEVRRDEKSLMPLAWEALPPTLIGLASGEYALSGQRSQRLEEAVRAAASLAGVCVERTRQGMTGPDRVVVSTASQSVAHSIAESMTDAAGVEIDVVNDAARRLASKLPPLATVIDSLPRQAMVGARSIKRWSTDVARWRSVGDASTPGVYQMLSPSPVYCIRNGQDVDNGTMRRVDVRLAKHAAALTDGERLTGYDEEARMLYVPLGADLPGLYGRAAVLCSGLLPYEDEHQRVTRYHDVPRDVAEHLAALLGGGRGGEQ